MPNPEGKSRLSQNWRPIATGIGIGFGIGTITGLITGPEAMEAIPHELMVHYLRDGFAAEMHTVLDQVVDSFQDTSIPDPGLIKLKMGMLLGALQGAAIGGVIGFAGGITNKIRRILRSLPT